MQYTCASRSAGGAQSKAIHLGSATLEELTTTVVGAPVGPGGPASVRVALLGGPALLVPASFICFTTKIYSVLCSNCPTVATASKPCTSISATDSKMERTEPDDLLVMGPM